MTFWLVVVLSGLITFATRLSFIAAEGRFAAPGWLRSMLPFVPIATLTAIIAPGIAQPGGVLDFSVHNGRLLAGAAAVVIAAVTRNVLLTIAGGFVVLWLAT